MDPGSYQMLLIDLTERRVETLPLARELFEKYLGGVGLGARLLLDYCHPGADPLSPQNPLVFVASPMAATLVPAGSKHALVTKSPLTGMIGDSLTGSFWSAALRLAGYQALVVTGAAETLTYLFIDDGRVYFKPASHLEGLGCWETEEAIRRDLRDSRVRIAAIGPAGEKLVRYAGVFNDGTRRAGRGGVGAVMGSKKLKAIALRGTQPVRVADMAGMERECFNLYKVAQDAPTEKYRVLGTPANILTLNRLGALPTRNFQQTTFSGAEAISGERLYESHLVKVTACSGCPIACEHIYHAGSGPPKPIRTRMDYETLFALGSLCGVDQASWIIRAAGLCDQHGMDSISTGGAIAWAMECFEKKFLGLEDTDGLELTFGNGPAMVEMVEKIAHRQGLGDLLAEGTRLASQKLGGGSDHWAIHAKGLELPGYEPRSLKTMALGFAVGTRGGCHNRSPSYEVDMSARVDRLKAEAGRGAMNRDQEDFAAVLDSLVICKFMRKCFSDFYADAARLYAASTGIELSPEDLRLAGERICHAKKAFNIREGWERNMDWLPGRTLNEAIPDGPAKGVRLTADELTLMIEDYYQARGWTPQGLIPREKLEEVGLGDLWLGPLDTSADRSTGRSTDRTPDRGGFLAPDSTDKPSVKSPDRTTDVGRFPAPGAREKTPGSSTPDGVGHAT
ncbi:MAG: aldehyde ferredoxin oxidoreductase family protein [Dehalococcoidia bacterium]|nr:aldehyde ferredoxin oxidoreductase family protein [Dehalococcoidia bacterium]